MSNWKIEAVKADPKNIGTHDLLLSFLTCSAVWRRLSKPAREAVRCIHKGAEVSAHPNTMHALERHAVVAWDSDGYHLTDAGAELARWMCRDD